MRAQRGKKETSAAEEGLRFECEPECGECCRRPGDVYVKRDELKPLADFLGLSIYKLKRTVVTKTEDGLWMINDPEDSPCRFLQNEQCAIYEVRPYQCRSFPFWPENIRSVKRWESLKALCPGIGRGRMHSVDEIADIVQKVEIDRLF